MSSEKLSTKVFMLFMVLICFGVFISLFSSFSLTNLPPYSDYTYTGYANTTSGIANLTQLATRLKTINVVPTDTSFAKSEYLYIKLHNANIASNNITANLTLNGATITAGMTTLYNDDTPFTFTNISCADGLNTISIGSTVATSNLTLINATIICATGYSGADWTVLIIIAVFMLAYIVLISLLSKK